MPDIRAMCAIGRRGQLGLNGRMPWEGAKGPEYTGDVQRFFELTRGHVILLGPRTYRSVPAFAHEDRTVVAIRSSEQPLIASDPPSTCQDGVRRFLAGVTP
ncbi:MAG: dihydrofolate reductase [Xanthobacteraceae bacterium]